MNYIFLFLDEMRADTVSCYGNKIVSMPNFDRVASEGVRFDKCFVQHPVCAPSRCSLMTGWYPHVRGHRTLWNLLREDEPSLFRYLTDAGYQVELYGKNDVFSPEHLSLALDKYKNMDLKNIFNDEKIECGNSNFEFEGLGEASFFSFLKPLQKCSNENTTDMKNISKAMQFLDNYEDTDKPFMLFLPTLYPHPPYTAPEEFYNMYEVEQITDLLPAELPMKPDFYSLIRKYRKLSELPDDHFKKIRAVYLGMNSYVDWMLGKLLEKIDEKNLADNTTVIISSDHGDWAGDYGLVEKWPSALDDKIIRVPLIIRSPGNKRGHVVNEQVELFDIMATILDISGIEVQHNHFAKSLLPQLKGAQGDKDRAVFAEGGYDKNEPNCFEGYENRENDITRFDGNIYSPKGRQQQEVPESVSRASMIRTLEYKLIYRSVGINELYDLKNDPNEIENLYYEPKYEEIRRTLEKRLLEWYIHTSDVTPLDEHPRDFPELI